MAFTRRQMSIFRLSTNFPPMIRDPNFKIVTRDDGYLSIDFFSLSPIIDN